MHRVHSNWVRQHCSPMPKDDGLAANVWSQNRLPSEPIHRWSRPMRPSPADLWPHPICQHQPEFVVVHQKLGIQRMWEFHCGRNEWQEACQNPNRSPKWKRHGDGEKGRGLVPDGGRMTVKMWMNPIGNPFSLKNPPFPNWMNLPINSEEHNIEDMKPWGVVTMLTAFFGVQSSKGTKNR